MATGGIGQAASDRGPGKDQASSRPVASEPQSVSFRFGAVAQRSLRSSGGRSSIAIEGIPSGGIGLTPVDRSAPQSLLDKYNKAVTREGLRSMRRDPYMLLSDPMKGDEDESLAHSRRQAERIFGKANRQLRNFFADQVISRTAPLRAARRFIDGIDLRLRRKDRTEAVTTGALSTGAISIEAAGVVAESEPRASSHSAQVSVSVSTNPRVEIRSRLPGSIMSRLEISLISAEIRTILSRQLTSNIRGDLSAGIEDGGNDQWISAGLSFRF